MRRHPHSFFLCVLELGVAELLEGLPGMYLRSDGPDLLCSNQRTLPKTLADGLRAVCLGYFL